MACGKFNMKAKLKKNAWQTVLIFQNSYNDKNYILIIWKKNHEKIMAIKHVWFIFIYIYLFIYIFIYFKFINTF